MFDLSGRSAVVVGATGNLGRRIVQRLLEQGTHVALPVRDPKRGEALRAELAPLAGEPEGPRLLVVAANPADRAAMDRLVEDALRRWGRLDILANIAGGFAMDAAADGDLGAMRASWDQKVATAVVATTACLRPMRARRYGRIVSVASLAALRGAASVAGYAMANAALVRWNESLAAELRGEGVTANVLLPTTMDTPENRAAMPKAHAAAWATLDEVASVVLFLATDEASGVTGAAIPVTARMPI